MHLPHRKFPKAPHYWAQFQPPYNYDYPYKIPQYYNFLNTNFWIVNNYPEGRSIISNIGAREQTNNGEYPTVILFQWIKDNGPKFEITAEILRNIATRHPYLEFYIFNFFNDDFINLFGYHPNSNAILATFKTPEKQAFSKYSPQKYDYKFFTIGPTESIKDIKKYIIKSIKWLY